MFYQKAKYTMQKFHGNYIENAANFCIFNIKGKKNKITYIDIIKKVKAELLSPYISQKTPLLKRYFPNTTPPLPEVQYLEDISKLLNPENIVGNTSKKTQKLIENLLDSDSYFKDILATSVLDASLSYIFDDAPSSCRLETVSLYLPYNNLVVDFESSINKFISTKKINVFKEHNIKYYLLPETSDYIYSDAYKKLVMDLQTISTDMLIKPTVQLLDNQKLYSFVSQNSEALRLTAIYRFEILLLTLLEKGIITLSDDRWAFHIANLDVFGYEKIAFADLFSRILRHAHADNLDITMPELELTCDLSYSNYSPITIQIPQGDSFIFETYQSLPIENDLKEHYNANGNTKHNALNILCSILTPWTIPFISKNWICLTNDFQQIPLDNYTNSSTQTLFTSPNADILTISDNNDSTDDSRPLVASQSLEEENNSLVTDETTTNSNLNNVVDNSTSSESQDSITPLTPDSTPEALTDTIEISVEPNLAEQNTEECIENNTEDYIENKSFGEDLLTVPNVDTLVHLDSVEDQDDSLSLVTDKSPEEDNNSLFIEDNDSLSTEETTTNNNLNNVADDSASSEIQDSITPLNPDSTPEALTDTIEISVEPNLAEQNTEECIENNTEDYIENKSFGEDLLTVPNVDTLVHLDSVEDQDDSLSLVTDVSPEEDSNSLVIEGNESLSTEETTTNNNLNNVADDSASSEIQESITPLTPDSTPEALTDTIEVSIDPNLAEQNTEECIENNTEDPIENKSFGEDLLTVPKIDNLDYLDSIDPQDDSFSSVTDESPEEDNNSLVIKDNNALSTEETTTNNNLNNVADDSASSEIQESITPLAPDSTPEALTDTIEVSIDPNLAEQNTEECIKNNTEDYIENKSFGEDLLTVPKVDSLAHLNSVEGQDDSLSLVTDESPEEDNNSLVIEDNESLSTEETTTNNNLNNVADDSASSEIQESITPLNPDSTPEALTDTIELSTDSNLGEQNTEECIDNKSFGEDLLTVPNVDTLAHLDSIESQDDFLSLVTDESPEEDINSLIIEDNESLSTEETTTNNNLNNVADDSASSGIQDSITPLTPDSTSEVLTDTIEVSIDPNLAEQNTEECIENNTEDPIENKSFGEDLLTVPNVDTLAHLDSIETQDDSISLVTDVSPEEANNPSRIEKDANSNNHNQIQGDTSYTEKKASSNTATTLETPTESNGSFYVFCLVAISLISIFIFIFCFLKPNN